MSNTTPPEWRPITPQMRGSPKFDILVWSADAPYISRWRKQETTWRHIREIGWTYYMQADWLK